MLTVEPGSGDGWGAVLCLDAVDEHMPSFVEHRLQTIDELGEQEDDVRVLLWCGVEESEGVVFDPGWDLSSSHTAQRDDRVGAID